jgi:microcystin-dependent protein
VSEPFLGQILSVPYTFAPRNWAFCDGQLLPISQQTALFSLLGTFYGGNGTSNFALPNLQGSVPIHAAGSQPGPGLSAYEIGESGGTDSVTVLTTEIPSHSHTVAPVASDDERTTDHPGGANPTLGGIYASAADSSAPMGTTASASAGGGAAHNNLQPYLVLNYVIAMAGIFPARS